MKRGVSCEFASQFPSHLAGVRSLTHKDIRDHTHTHQEPSDSHTTNKRRSKGMVVGRHAEHGYESESAARYTTCACAHTPKLQKCSKFKVHAVTHSVTHPLRMWRIAPLASVLTRPVRTVVVSLPAPLARPSRAPSPPLPPGKVDRRQLPHGGYVYLSETRQLAAQVTPMVRQRSDRGPQSDSPTVRHWSDSVRQPSDSVRQCPTVRQPGLSTRKALPKRLLY